MVKMNAAAVLPMTNATRLPSVDETSEAYPDETGLRNGNGELPAHSAGLSALLSAVTLQLNDSSEKEKASSKTSKSAAKENHRETVTETKKEPTKTTPTMVPEAAKHLPLAESLMTLLLDDRNADILTFLPNGMYFAIRTQEFTLCLLKQYFAVDTFEDFLKELRLYGFTRIETDQEGIEVFRHRLFRKGDMKLCEQLIGEAEERKKNGKSSPCQVGQHEGSLDDLSVDRSDGYKRRLSPAHAAKVTSSQPTSRKARTLDNAKQTKEVATTMTPSAPEIPSPVEILRSASEEDYQSAARIIASEKLSLNGQGHDSSAQQLEQQAVVDTTRSIVTDAIETLLRDEDHTRKTFRKHERALSQSALPGVVPISKQLFSSKQEKTEQPGVALPAAKKPSGANGGT